MTRYGISDPAALSYAVRLSAKTAAGYLVAMFACHAIGPDMLGAQAFSLLFFYAFAGTALMLSARRRALTGGSSITMSGRVLVVAMLAIGGILVLSAVLSLGSVLVWLLMSALG
jgi:hypothetical protein